jgi:uncharacterized membrane protein (DUF2068 family)
VCKNSEGKLSTSLKTYLRVLSALYFFGATLHILDILDLRLKFSGMSLGWKIWIAFLLFGDIFASIGLWNRKPFGEYGFLLISGSQLLAYSFFSNFFGKQYQLVLFHMITIIIYVVLKWKTKTVEAKC